MLAEEEMKKLATKRKDFESAARELDALRARARPATRMSQTTASRIFDLNIFERGEIVDYPDVFFTGTLSARKIVGDLNSASTNFGYDDERGDYNIVEGDHLAYRYEVVDLLGKGSFGQVVRCVDHKTGILVAVKIIRNKKRFHQQALVEVNILQKLKEWVSLCSAYGDCPTDLLQDPHKKHSVVNFDQEFYFRGHLCISTDLLGMNLYEFIKAHDFRGFSLKLIRRFTKQLLQCLMLLQSHKVIHCDLKPENILLAHPVHSEIKVIDFGSSCFENEKVYTYIQSRFYRSPEVILGMSYGMPIDMWSIGCILAELYTGYPIFPGENEQEQLACIMEVFGPPEKHLIEKSSRKKLFFDSMGKPRLTVSSKGKRRRPSSKELRQVLRCDDDAFLDFIAKCLKWDPTRRMTPQEATKHEFITGVKISTAAARRAPQAAVNSPVKRVNSVTTAGGARPLPIPPTNLKAPIGGRQETSPNKPAARRQSTMPGSGAFAATSQAKRASHAAMTNSVSNPNIARPMGGQRTTARSDLAQAAAAASLVK
jgi:dual specificity tyrosine-phosphorylation-regulated kinase 2/3/4